MLGAGGGCRSERRAADKGAPSASVATRANATATAAVLPSASAGGVPVALDEAKARAFVAHWAETQNAHDFSAYSALYAERFAGLKRVGTYSKRFDRSSWLKDREPMLHAGTSVRISELQVQLSQGAARVVLTQDFSAPGFQDSGKKQLFLVASGAGILISREEMLVSQVAMSQAGTKREVFAFHRDGPVLELSSELGASKGQPHLLPHKADDAYVVAAAIAPTELSESTRSWLGRSVTVYAKNGATCSGAVARFELRVAAVPHFGMVQAWNGEADQPKASPAQIATEIWNIASDNERFVVGVLDEPCHGAWATAGSPAWVPAQTAPAGLRASAILAFKALPHYRELQAKFVTENSDTTHAWEEIDGELAVVQLRPASGPTLVIVSARGGASCNAFSGGMSAIWQVAAGGALSLRQVIDTGTDLLDTHGAVDSGAGLQLLTGPDGLYDQISVLQPKASGFELSVLFSTAYWDCGC